MQLNCSIASLNRLRDAITVRALHSNCVYRPVGTTTLIERYKVTVRTKPHYTWHNR